MVLESVATASLAKRRPEEFIFYGFIVATVALLLSIWVFPAYASFALVTFTVMATLPLMIGVIKSEKEKIKERVVSLLKIRCEMSQDPVICSTFQQLKEG